MRAGDGALRGLLRDGAGRELRTRAAGGRGRIDGLAVRADRLAHGRCRDRHPDPRGSSGDPSRRAWRSRPSLGGGLRRPQRRRPEPFGAVATGLCRGATVGSAFGSTRRPRAPGSAPRASRPAAPRRRRARRAGVLTAAAFAAACRRALLHEEEATGGHRADGHEATEHESDDGAVALLLLCEGRGAERVLRRGRRGVAGRTTEAGPTRAEPASDRRGGMLAGPKRRHRRRGLLQLSRDRRERAGHGTRPHGGGLVIEEARHSRAACTARGRDLRGRTARPSRGR